MLILAMETSAKACSTALMEDGRLLGQSYQNSGLTHSQTLLAMAQDLLGQCQKEVADVDAVAVAAGPGSFTCVRIGMAAAKGFAWGRDIPCVAVSTLEAMALSLGAYDGYVCPVMDARRNEVYNALFRADCGKLTRLSEDRAISLSELGKDAEKLDKPIFLVGDGSELCYNYLLKSIPNLVLPPEHRRHQRADGVALLAWSRLREGSICPDGPVVPNYLRLSQAERERAAREQHIEKEI